MKGVYTESTARVNCFPLLFPPVSANLTAFMEIAANPSTGAFSLASLLDAPPSPAPQIIKGLLTKGSINLLIGDSGLGKTALGMQMGMAVAGGVPFLNFETEQGTTLYIDAESPFDGFRGIVLNQRRFLGVSATTPFFAYSMQWDKRESQPFSWLAAIREQVELLKPSLVIIDPLRAVFPLAETKTDQAQEMVATLRKISKEHGTTWLITHHVRKVNREYEAPDLLSDPHGWLQEAAGSRALITGADTRIGVTAGEGEIALLMCGYTRLTGTLPPIRLTRALDEHDGDPLGYQLCAVEHSLSERWLELYRNLPETFQASEVKKHLKSGKTAYRFLTECVGAGLLSRNHSTKWYTK